MALTIADRVRETTTTTGTGTVTLAGAATGYQTFTSKVVTGDQCNYVISLGAEWEVGVGTMASTTTLARTTVLASSNAGALVNFSAGIKDVFLTHPAALMESMLLKDRNLVHNGAMNVCQRKTSSTVISTAGYWTLDRWQFEVSSFGTWTMSQTTDGPAGTGLQKCVKLLATTAEPTPATPDYCVVTQRIEGQFLQTILKGTAAAKPLTLSFWVKSNVTGTYIAQLYDLDNARWVSAAYTISVSATWEYKTITFPADTTGAFDNDSAYSLRVSFWLGAGTDYTSGALGTTWNTTQNKSVVGQVNVALSGTTNYWQVTGVQLEVGSIPTPFEIVRFDEELITCMRYFEKSYQYADAPGAATVGYTYEKCYATSATNIDPGPSVYFKVRKRITPTTFAYYRPDGTAGSWLWANGANPAAVITYIQNESGFKTYTTGCTGLTGALWYTVNGHWTASVD